MSWRASATVLVAFGTFATTSAWAQPTVSDSLSETNARHPRRLSILSAVGGVVSMNVLWASVWKNDKSPSAGALMTAGGFSYLLTVWSPLPGQISAERTRYGLYSGAARTGLVAAGVLLDLALSKRGRQDGEMNESGFPVFSLLGASAATAWCIYDIWNLPSEYTPRREQARIRVAPMIISMPDQGSRIPALAASGRF